MIFSQFNTAASGINLITKRFIRKKIIMKSWPNDWVPFHWKRPEKVPGYYDSSDLVDLADPSSKELRPDVKNSDELKKLDHKDPLRRIFSLSHARRYEHNKSYTNEQLKKLGLIHKVDQDNSLEAKIISLTFSLRHTIEQIKVEGDKSRFNGKARLVANNIKNKRYRYLCDLKELHGDRFERIKAALNVEPRNNLINVPYLRPFRKKQMRKLAIEYSRDLKEKKVKDFLESIEQEKVEFEKGKKEALKWIEEQEKILGIQV